MRLKSLSTLKKAFFAYPGDQDGAKFEIGLLTPGEERDIQAAANRVEMGDSGGNNVVVDFTKASFLRAARCIRGWENVFHDDKAEKPMPCNEANKVKLLNTAPGFEAWVLEKYNELASEAAKAREEEEKNS